MNTQFQESGVQQPTTFASDSAVEPKKGTWIKWLLIIMAILVLAAGFFYWIFA